MRALTLLVLVATSPAAAALTCSLDTVIPASLGGYDPFAGAPLDTAGSITFNCSGATAGDTVAIELSTGAAGSFSPRRLMAGAYALEYNLYLDAARTQVWGDGSGGTHRYVLSGLALNGTHVVPIHGRAPAGQNARVGNYVDGVTVTLLL